MAPVRIRWVAYLLVAAFATFASILTAASRSPQGTALTPTSTTVVSSVNPSTLGQSVTFTATVTVPPPSGTAMQKQLIVIPTGNVSFLDGATNLGTVPLSAGVASLTTSLLAAGSHNITASYTGAFAPSTSPILVQTVGAATIGAVPTLGAFGLVLLGLALASVSVRLIRR